jgi:hypothetical protein
MSEMSVVTSDQILGIMKKNDALIQEITDKNEKLLIKYRFFIFGVKVGDIVKQPGTGILYKIKRFRHGTGKYDKPWVVGNPRKKDGTFSIKEINIYSDWVVVPGEPK